MDLVTAAVALLGGGSLGVVATKVVEWRKAGLEVKRQERQEDREAETKLVQDLRSMLLDERKLVQDERAAFHDERKGHLDCMDRVIRVEGQLVDIQREHAGCPGKISKLESQVEELRGLALERYTKSDSPPPVRG